MRIGGKGARDTPDIKLFTAIIYIIMHDAMGAPLHRAFNL